MWYDFTRVITGLARLLFFYHAAHLWATVTIAAITSTSRSVPSEVLLDQRRRYEDRCAVNRVARLSTLRTAQVCAALRFSLGCDSQDYH